MKPTKFLFFLLLANISYCQTPKKIISATCSFCYKNVSIHSKVGQTCPHCGVTWGKERQSLSFKTEVKPTTYQNQPIQKKSSKKDPLADFDWSQSLRKTYYTADPFAPQTLPYQKYEKYKGQTIDMSKIK
ncbi:MAG: hypothetical protein U0V04_17125 [Spirosomataceae bacterium]|jgi:hypothetical protein